MAHNEAMDRFFDLIKGDTRIGPCHISLFMAIIQQHQKGVKDKTHICVFGRELMKLAKISGVATYHKCIKELHEYGYITYEPSYNNNAGSVISVNTDNEFQNDK